MTTESGAPAVSNYLEWSDKGKPAVWRYLIAVVAGFVIWQAGTIPIMFVLKPLLGDPAVENVVIQYTFLVGLAVVPLLTWLLLRRPWWSVALPSWPPRRLADYGVGVAVQWGSMLVMYLLVHVPFGRITYRGWSGELEAGLLLLLATIVGFVIQTAFEEVYFRGLVEQAVRRVTKWMPVVIGVQAVFFASLHVGNVGAWGSGAVAMLPYLCTAVALAWGAWRTGSLLIGMGMHFGNNILLALVINTKGDVVKTATPLLLQTPELWRASVFALGQAAIAILLIELIVRRREL